MANENEVVKHVLLAKFNDNVTPEKIMELIHGYADLINQITVLKSFVWGKDVSTENLNQGFTHIFESAFESTEAIADYLADEKHVEFANLFLPQLEKVIVIDYKPTSVCL
ncbi:hypothetical protein KSS87_013149 [Heliosperma pusillum]|nr:hypothetical protein KSS87_013149 [Heliosperma pusillum]